MKTGKERLQYVPDRPGHDFRYALNTGKIKKLGFKLQWKFEDALRETVNWYGAHPEWWKPLKKDKFTVK